MKENKYGTKHDYEQELSEALELELHETGKCGGPPRCGYCLDEQQLEAELAKAEGAVTCCSLIFTM